ncbi:hypothetical protein Pmani_028226 [Petrolisthes manimaculis]|uniref:Uncharacterized protein n=1 Tax=Petrolisthes manimaculis TaxID=1843537 RepID=A0AAE1TVX0_9EUCA|nr:hypothetical protein Pmani_028226 [Petrolisthes manimaculis]
MTLDKSMTEAETRTQQTPLLSSPHSPARGVQPQVRCPSPHTHTLASRDIELVAQLWRQGRWKTLLSDRKLDPQPPLCRLGSVGNRGEVIRVEGRG